MHERRRRISRRRAELEKEERCGVNNKWSKFKIKLVHLNKLINSKRGEESEMRLKEELQPASRR